RTSIATETCVNSNGNWQKTVQNLAIWQDFLRDNGRLALNDIVQHNHWSGKNCPYYLRLSNGAQWDELLARIRGVQPPVPPPPNPNFRFFEQTRHTIGGAFKREWERMEGLGLAMQL